MSIDRTKIDRDTARKLFGNSRYSIERRRKEFDQCDRFAYIPPDGVGFTGAFGFLYGYRGDDFLLATICAPLPDKMESGE